MTEERNGYVYREIAEENPFYKHRKIIVCAVLLAVVIIVLIVDYTVMAQDKDDSALIFITEIVTSNKFSYVDEKLGSPDWIELYNASDSDISLAGYGISDNTARPYKYTFPDMTIEAGKYLVVYAMPDITTDDICLGFKLSKDGETIMLTDAQGAIVQTLNVPKLSEDVSWGRTSDGRYRYIAEPTAGQANSSVSYDTLEDIKRIEKTSEIVISEIMPRALIAGEESYYSWVEIHNISSEVRNLSDFYLSDDKDKPKKWRFPDIELAANGYLVVYSAGFDETGQLLTNFKFSDSETRVYLTDGDKGLISESSWPGDMPGNVSIGIDIAGTEKYYSIPTPGNANTTNAFESYERKQIQNSLSVSEILLCNECCVIDKDGDRPSWVEVCNTSDETLSLADYYLSNEVSNPYKWQFPNIIIEPGEYLQIYLSGKDKANGELHTNFEIDGDEAFLIVSDRKNFDETRFALDMDTKPDISYGVDYSGEWVYFGRATPGAENEFPGQKVITNAQMFDINDLYISEVSAVGEPRSDSMDWIEIANGSDTPINLSGYYLSDSTDEPYKWTIPDITVPAKGFAVIYAASDETKQTVQTAPFGISSSGETLLLSSPCGALIDSFDTGVLYPGQSAGRLDGDLEGRRVFFTCCTKGKANESAAFASYTASPAFSQRGGYTESGTIVNITCKDDNALIYYTTNGDEPTTSSKLYTEGIEINKSVTLRAIAVSPDCLASPIVTANYLVEDRHDIDVLCISGDWDEIRHAYSSSRNDREVGVNIEYYEQDGRIGTAFPAGLRVTGLISRTYPQKSLKIFLRGEYGQKSVTYPFFDNYDVINYQSLTIRNSGQDLYHAHIKTAFFEMAVQDLNIDSIRQKPVAVYINGRYWGMYWLCENQNEDHFASAYDFDRDDIEIIRRNDTVVAGTNEEFLAVRKFARTHDMADEENYNEFITMVDEQAFMDYIIVQTYIGNWDMYNQKYWRTVDYEHEWRPMLFDLDYAFRYPGSCYLSSYFSRYGVTWEGGDKSQTNMDIPHALLQNEGWKQAFIERYAYLLQTTFAPETIVAHFDSMVEEVESEMERQISRWHAPASMKNWRNEIDKLREILLNRSEKCKKDMQRYFRLTDERMAELFPDDGY